MQDGAPGHASGYTFDELVNRGIQLIFRPPFSPDLNPIETVWIMMKDWIQDRYGEGRLSYDRLRQAVKEAWEAVCQDQLEELIDSMHDRCQAVIDANGMHWKLRL